MGAEVSVVAGKVVEVRDRQTSGAGGLPIPVGGYVLSVALGQPDGASTPPTPPSTPAMSGNLPSKVVGGYLTTWEARNGVTLRSLVDNTNYNLIYVAFALGVTASSGALQLVLPPGASSPADFKSQVAYANSKGKKVIVSVGG